jgi:hypothetical protein
VRLLRDPFGAASTAPVAGFGQIDPDFGIHFGPDGGRLAVRLRNGAVLVQLLPGSPREKPGRPRLIQEARGLALVAVGFAAAGCVLAHLKNGELMIRRLGPRGGFNGEGGTPLPSVDRHSPRAGATPGALYLTQGVLIDSDGRLFELNAGQWEYRGIGIGSSTLGVSRVIWVGARLDESSATEEAVLEAAQQIRVPLHQRFERVIAFQGFSSPRSDLAGLAAVMVAKSRWALLNGVSRMELYAPSDAQVVGVANQGDEPGLLLLENGVLSLAGKSFSQALPLPGRIVMARASPYRPVVAAVGDGGQLYVWSLKHRAVVLNLQPGER